MWKDVGPGDLFANLLDREGLEIGHFTVGLPKYSDAGVQNLHPCFGLYLGTFRGCRSNKRALEVRFVGALVKLKEVMLYPGTHLSFENCTR